MHLSHTALPKWRDIYKDTILYEESYRLFQTLKNERSTQKKIISRGTRLFRIFNNMKQRCYNKKHPQYHNYGEKGIFVCHEWLIDSNNFYKWALKNGYKDNLTIERINNNGIYSPDNCRWISRHEQARNRSTNIFVEIDGSTMCLLDWCRHYQINYRTVISRIHAGWDMKKAILTPVGRKRS